MNLEPIYFAAKNLTSQEVVPVIPWNFTDLSHVPIPCFKDKKAREKWQQDSTTNHQFLSSWEGVNPNQRPSVANPPVYLGALTYDVDCKLTPPEIDGILARYGEGGPNKLEQTFSDQWRFHWLFERRVPIANAEFAAFLHGKLPDLVSTSGVPNVDACSFSRLFCNGGRWTHRHDRRIPWTRLLGWWQKVSAEYTWAGKEKGIEMPPSEAAKLLAKKYPRFAQWPGDFKDGAQGPSFWVAGSESPGSAFVRPTGMQTYSSHAEQSFFTWAELLTAEEVRVYRHETMGKAVDNTWFDGKHYVRRTAHGKWVWEFTDDLTRHLRTECGISDRRPKGATHSPVDEALMFVRNNKLVTAAGSYAFYPKGIFADGNRQLLNIHEADVLQPAGPPGPAVWGQGFPWLAHFLNQFLTTPEQLEMLMAWLAYFYRSCYNRAPVPGQAVVFAGEAGRGKSLFIQRIMKILFSGYADCREWLMGGDAFNSELFDCAVWGMDDGSPAEDTRAHRRFTERTKRAVASPVFRINEKFKKAFPGLWSGRILIACNIDAESLRTLPALDISNKDKISMFLVTLNRTDGFFFPDQATIHETLMRELPHFARWLLDWTIPDACIADKKRFCIKDYQHPDLVSNAYQNSPASTFGEILNETMDQLFVRHPEHEQWSGTALQLHKLIMGDPSLTEAMRPFSVSRVGPMMGLLQARSWPIEVKDSTAQRIYIVRRTDDYWPKKPFAEPTKETLNTKHKKHDTINA